MRINEDYNDDYEEFLHGNCHQWVIDNFCHGDVIVVIQEYDWEIDETCLAHALLKRNGRYLDVRGFMDTMDEVLEEFDCDDSDVLYYDKLEDFILYLEDKGIPYITKINEDYIDDISSDEVISSSDNEVSKRPVNDFGFRMRLEFRSDLSDAEAIRRITDVLERTNDIIEFSEVIRLPERDLYDREFKFGFEHHMMKVSHIWFFILHLYKVLKRPVVLNIEISDSVDKFILSFYIYESSFREYMENCANGQIEDPMSENGFVDLCRFCQVMTGLSHKEIRHQLYDMVGYRF
jgi:hypothetical protein